MFETKLYPGLKVDYPQNPSKLYAFPVLGGLIKGISLIPVMIELYLCFIALCILTLVNAFVVLFTGKYLEANHRLFVGVANLMVKSSLFMVGLTDKYPGFSFQPGSNYKLEIPMPTAPSRMYAIPLLGAFLRALLIIPFYIFMYVYNMAAVFGVLFVASFTVLFTGKYQEGVYQMVVDYLRLTLSYFMWFLGLDDKYPSFAVNLKDHKTLKVILLILSVLYIIANFSSSLSTREKMKNGYYPTDLQQSQQEYTLPAYE